VSFRTQLSSVLKICRFEALWLDSTKVMAASKVGSSQCWFLSKVLRSAAQRSTTQRSAAQHSTAQRGAAQHSTAQRSTALHRGTAQRSAAQHNSAAQLRTAQRSAAQGECELLTQ
jgi:hypothetical protein